MYQCLTAADTCYYHQPLPHCYQMMDAAPNTCQTFVRPSACQPPALCWLLQALLAVFIQHQQQPSPGSCLKQTRDVLKSLYELSDERAGPADLAVLTFGRLVTGLHHRRLEPCRLHHNVWIIIVSEGESAVPPHSPQTRDGWQRLSQQYVTGRRHTDTCFIIFLSQNIEAARLEWRRFTGDMDST